MNLIILGFLVHIVFILSIFDIYFKSPIVSGITPDTTLRPAPARRLVLFVADGFRSEAFYKACKNLDAPYLKFVVENKGTWGVSHTRVPTETRPGHVALIAGIYEDPSAVAKGWKENPVEFDTVFNQSKYTWSWGSPDILPMFAKGASGSHVFIDTYDPNLEDFSGKETTSYLDSWVFDKVEQFLTTAVNDSSLVSKLNSHQVVFFLHLLGLDTAGHTHKPGSKEYIENIRVVDEGIRRMEELFEQFYNHDNKTSYVFTADHGMTDWGSHGAGDASETETPLIVWGAGINKPISLTDTENKLDALRRDVNQADIAALIAALIGIPFPVNSVGRVPKGYLNLTEHETADIIFANARQILAQYRMKREMIEMRILDFLNYPFPLLTREKEHELLTQIINDTSERNWDNVAKLSETLISLSLDGLDYYHNYHQSLLLTCMTLAYLGWIAWLLCKLSKEEDLSSKSPFTFSAISKTHERKLVAQAHFLRKLIFWLQQGSLVVNCIFAVFSVTSLILISVQFLPPQFYIYCLLPQILWWIVLRENSVIGIIQYMKNLSEAKYQVFIFAVYMIGIEILVLSFFHRFVLSIGMLGIMSWPFFSCVQQTGGSILISSWIVSCVLMALFPMLPVVGSQPNDNMLIWSGCLWLLFGLCCTKFFRVHEENWNVFLVWLSQLLIVAIAVWNIYSVSSSLEGKFGLQTLNQVISWLLFAISLGLPLLGPVQVKPRLVSIVLALSVQFLLLSASHEGLFLLTLCVNMLCWLALESNVLQGTLIQESSYGFQLPAQKKKTSRTFSMQNCRHSFLFLYYIILSFFGTGNIASLNSFDPIWVRCFVTVFSPFLMTALILWKTVVPFFIVSCTFRALNAVLEVPAEKLFLTVLVFCDAMGMHFLHLVTNQGSWLEIGTSISHFVIIQTIILFLVILYGVAQFLMGFSLWPILKCVVVKFHNSKTFSISSVDSSLETGILNESEFNYRNLSRTLPHSEFRIKKHTD